MALARANRAIDYADSAVEGASFSFSGEASDVIYTSTDAAVDLTDAVDFKFPTIVGPATNMLATDGAGNMEWSSPAGTDRNTTNLCMSDPEHRLIINEAPQVLYRFTANETFMSTLPEYTPSQSGVFATVKLDYQHTDIAPGSDVSIRLVRLTTGQRTDANILAAPYSLTIVVFSAPTTTSWTSRTVSGNISATQSDSATYAIVIFPAIADDWTNADHFDIRGLTITLSPYA